MQSIDIQEFKGERLKASDLFKYLKDIVKNTTIMQNVNMRYLEKYASRSRDIIICDNHNGCISLYITTEVKSNNACKIEASSNY